MSDIEHLDARRARPRGAAQPPMAAYATGRDAALAMLDLRDAERIAIALQAVADGDPDAVAEALDGLPADDITALQTAAETLAELCAASAAGRRS